MNTVRSGEAADGPEHASNPPSRETARWAAILCFIAAFMCLVGTGWSAYARWATDDSLGRLGGYLPQDATSALGAMDTLNTVVAVLNAILAVALVVGGIMLLRRKPAGRIVVAVAGVFLLLAPVVTHVLATQIWSRLVAAMSETSDVEVMRFGPGLGTMIRGVLVALVMLGLVLAPSTKRWLTCQGADCTDRRDRPPRRRWVVLVCAVVVAVVAGGMAVVHWRPLSSPGEPSNAQEAPVGTPKDRLIGFALDRQPVPAWQVSVTDLGFTPETRVGDLFAAVSDRAYFSTLRSDPDKTVTGLVYGLDTKTGKPLFPPIEMPGWAGVTCSTNGPSVAVCVTDSCPDSIISCTGQHEQLWVIDLDEGKVTYTGDPKVQGAGNLESRSHPGRPVLVPLGPSHGASWLVASAEGKGVYGVGSQGEPTWFLPGNGDLVSVEINDPRVDDIAPLTVGIQKSSSGNDFRVFSVDGRDLTPTPPQGQRVAEVRAYVGGFAVEFDGGPRPRGVGLYDSDGKQVAMLTGFYAMANPAMPIIAQNRPGKNYDTGGLQVYTAAGKPQVNVPASILDHFRMIGTKLYAGEPPGAWRSWDLFTGQQGPACDMQLDSGEYVGSDGTTVIWRDISNQEFIAVDPATCQTLWKVPVKTGDDSFEVMQKAGTSLLRLTEHTIAGLRPPA
ncbi:hypothetical protein [Mycobacteroides chelonae]|jgi:hypothetical protein|uniref:hypothetical protein n=1 Tax=Mycobacteroides chelonae TaxID=1774 RepID=UPI00095DA370|nr:hypothetical protein [Mycobacteroides chelonae]OLT84266.1 hypothetical protein BKG57_05415 [Mycobacteroides chelonae]WED89883.1 hypothetical protein PXJ67_13275 [Mycobacteroides chelonae]WED97895.1 hypothetical protein PYW02_05180 [Mycobacteroides chelonae]